MYDTSNPYQAPSSAVPVWLTSKGFTPAQCFCRFLVLGIFAGAIGSVGLYVLTRHRQEAAIQLISLGLSFGLSLWFSIQLWIGSIPTTRKMLIMVGGLIAFATSGAVYGLFLPEQFWKPQPITWKLLRPCVYGPAAGAAVIAIVLRYSGRRLTKRMLFYAWSILSVFGFVAMSISDELGMRGDVMSEALAASVCGSIYVAVVLSVIGWQLALDNSRQQLDGEVPDISTEE